MALATSCEAADCRVIQAWDGNWDLGVSLWASRAIRCGTLQCGTVLDTYEARFSLYLRSWYASSTCSVVPCRTICFIRPRPLDSVENILRSFPTYGCVSWSRCPSVSTATPLISASASYPARIRNTHVGTEVYDSVISSDDDELELADNVQSCADGPCSSLGNSTVDDPDATDWICSDGDVGVYCACYEATITGDEVCRRRYLGSSGMCRPGDHCSLNPWLGVMW